MTSTVKIFDEFTNLNVSRQRKYQLRKLKQGCCIICGIKILNKNKNFCPKHAELKNVIVLKSRGIRVRKLNSKYGKAGERV